MVASNNPAGRFRSVCRPLLLALVFSTVLTGVPGGGLSAQDYYSFPYREGNFLRYRIENGPSPVDTAFVLSFGYPGTEFPDPDLLLDSILVMRSGPRMFNMLNMAIVCIKPDGLFLVSDSLFPQSAGRRVCEYFPVFPPPADTMILRNTRVNGSGTEIISEHPVRLLRQFDTTVFDTPTRAFTVSIGGGDTVEILTIADGFGIASIELQTPEGAPLNSARLTGGIIAGRRYNWDPLQRQFLPLCEGDVYQFKIHVIQFWPTPGDTTYYAVDTVRSAGMIRGEEYMSYKGSILRNEIDGVYGPGFGEADTSAVRKRLFLPAHAEIGCIFNGSRITDTTTLTVLGEKRMAILLTPFFGEQAIVDGPAMWESWTDGIGMDESFSGCHGCMWAPTDDYVTLVYAEICGQKYGSKAGIPSPDVSSPEGIFIHQNYPNPASRAGGSNIDVTLDAGARVSVELRSLLGRRIAVPYDDHLTAGRHTLHIDTGGLTPGVYCIVVRTGKQALVRTMVLR